ncbi:hypothetical protein H6F86_26030 [Phormidium sp. FACHB-592]|uniref:Uncharacterized protein n=1 Tax=Stenomitos frigidus AS-A4 TaxID=2933935 RepID=A0ABV0KTV0_9CYAN|nr:hypothetical protein [Phormidium sp. FACHB-592]MBD2077275.1 hypothetical protein [Phormidium sp. FACHB-592]
MHLLFETPEAAREVAFMLQCEYDGFTMITLPSIHDTLALRTAIELTGTDFCFAGDHYPLVLSSTTEDMSQVSDQPVERMSRKAELWQDIAPVAFVCLLP